MSEEFDVDDCCRRNHNAMLNTATGRWLAAACREIDRLRAKVREAEINEGRYEVCLQAAAQRLQAYLSLGEIKAIGLMEVPDAIDVLNRQYIECRKELLDLKAGLAKGVDLALDILRRAELARSLPGAGECAASTTDMEFGG